MQQTKLDRWLIKKFILVQDIKLISLPQTKWIRKMCKPLKEPGSYSFIITLRDEKKSQKVIDELVLEGVSCYTDVRERKTIFSWLINNPQKSFTFRMFWNLVFVTSLISLSAFCYRNWESKLLIKLRKEVFKSAEKMIQDIESMR